MNIHDLKLDPIERVACVTSDQVRAYIRGKRRPLIFSGLDAHFKFLRTWDLERLARIESLVSAQRPAPDGVNYFTKYTKMPLSEACQRLERGEDLYIGARKILGNCAVRFDRDGLGELHSDVVLPPWLDRTRIASANLWLGAGGNRTLLHFDPWDGYLMLGGGKKTFVVLPPEESPKVFANHPLDYKALLRGELLDSRIRPLNVQEEYEARFRSVKGFKGSIDAGEMMYIPAGFWHYVESSGANVGINFFVHADDQQLFLREPLLTWWIKTRVTMWPIRTYRKAELIAGTCFRSVFPRRD